MMKLGIMQPYFLPYIGYYQLIHAVDIFVVYDNIQYSKRGWINRNWILLDGKPHLFSLPLQKDSDYLNINERYIADTFVNDREKLLRRIEAAYRKAPYYNDVMPLLHDCLYFSDRNLFNFLLHSIQVIMNYLQIEKEILISSQLLKVDHLKKQDKVLAICREMRTSQYINLIGGYKLYDTNQFSEYQINLSFLKPKRIHYKQFNGEFFPDLSIIDIMMFNPIEEIHKYLHMYSLINK